MISRSVIFAPEAQDDLFNIYNQISAKAGIEVGFAYTERLEAYCRHFDFASQRGHLREDIRSGLRIVGFERRVTIAFTVEEFSVNIIRLFYGGRDWETELTGH